MNAVDDFALAYESDKKDVSEEVITQCRARAKLMLRDLKKTNRKQYELVTDPSPHIAGLCPRRAGKSYAGAEAALIQGEAEPGSISIIISLNKQQLRRIYWSGGPSGLYMLNRKYKLNLTFNGTFLRWEHENGSIGYLLGCEDDEQMEVIRGLEADIYLIDECKSFAPQKLDKLIEHIIDPQRGSRNARVILIGTPGYIAAGPFYQATCLTSVDEDGLPFARLYGTEDPAGRTPADDLLWSLHTWTLEENKAKPEQWTAALLKKRQKKWADDHPTWQREYLGMWTVTSEGLVFSYAANKSSCTWVPQVTPANPTGLPEEGAPWRLIGGLDIGWEAPSAFVVCAYSARLRQLRHVADYSKSHLLPHELAELVNGVQRKLGKLEVIYADMANLGVMVAEELIRDYGLPLEKSEKRNKNDFIELMNSAFSLGEMMIIPGTMLEHQLLTGAWDINEEFEVLGKHAMSAKENMARMSKLVVDKSIPDDSTDALIYCYRGSLHRFGKTKKEERLTPGTIEFLRARERAELEVFRKQLKKQEVDAKKANKLPNIPPGLMKALDRKNRWATPKLS